MKDTTQVAFGKVSINTGFRQWLLFVYHAWLLGCAAVLWSAPRSKVLYRELFR